MKARSVWAAGLSVGLIIGCHTPPGLSNVRVDRLQVRVETVPGGSLRVRETFTLQPLDATQPMTFSRTLATTRADGLLFESAQIDGRPTEPGHEGLVIVTDQPNRIGVAWTGQLSAASKARVVETTVRGVSAIAVTEPRASLIWPILVAGRGFDVSRVEVELVLEPGSSIYPGTGMSEAGWTVEQTPTGIRAARVDVTDADTATLAAVFDLDRRGVPDPVWERNLDRQRQFLPALVSGALFFVVIGVGTIVIMRAQFPRRSKPRPPAAGPPPTEAERAMAVRGLRLAGAASAAAAVVTAAVAAVTLEFLGAWVQLIPGAMLMVGVAFVAYAPRLAR